MLTIGMYVADRYEIVHKIGAGGMSDVFKAKDHILGRFVAIKVLKQEFSEDVNFVAKFRTEAQSAAGLEHPNIVNIYDVGSEDGMYYIVMEYVEGVTLKTYIQKKGQLNYKEAISIAIQVGRGIEAAHNKHIIHRDIKPQNIIISTEGKVKVTDFGIARATNGNTIHTDVMGTVHYTSPEQARNGFVDGKSDIYSLGIVMYEMVTGRVPFDGDTAVAVAIQHLQEEMPIPSIFAPDLPISMERIILKCTQKNPDRRYGDISEVLTDLRKALISPDEDFVKIIPMGQENSTRVVPRQELETITEETNDVYYGEDEEEEEEYEDEEEGGFLNPRMEKAVTIMGIVAAVIIVAIIICIIGNAAGLFKFGGKDREDEEDSQVEDRQDDEDKDKEEEEEVVMIDLSDMTEEEAKKALHDINLGYRKLAEVSSEEYDVGRIVSQSVEKGVKVKKNETIEVTVSSGPGEFSVPNVVGRDESEAREILEDADLNPKRDYVNSDTVPEGQVVSQTPDAGSSAKKGDTVIYYISSGPELVTVPYVIGKSEAQGRAELEAAGLSVGNVTPQYDDNVAEGLIISQGISSGSQQNKGTAVDLVVSQGKQTVYYSYNDTITAPPMSDGSTVVGVSSVELYKAESNEAIPVHHNGGENSGNTVTVSASNIENWDRGTLWITWITAVMDEEGNVVSTDIYLDERNVSFRQQ